MAESRIPVECRRNFPIENFLRDFADLQTSNKFPKLGMEMQINNLAALQQPSLRGAQSY